MGDLDHLVSDLKEHPFVHLVHDRALPGEVVGGYPPGSPSCLEGGK
ncbi:MAG: hypothetical protein ACYCUF_12580 [Acidimicrobiales bacterium]|nr:hypothetical protein [Actinomycetota bacterium]